MQHASVDDTVNKILSTGPGTLLDIEHAYRNIPIHPSDRHLLGMEWEGSYFINTVLPFRLRSAPKIFSAVADGLEWSAQKAGVSYLLHCLDDFLGAPNSDE